jgi:NADH-quinone oxidoreductase subunit L
MAQPDLKRVVAYSTCSQLGSMLAGCCSIGSCSVQACSSGFWQMLTHAADKAVLFLLAGCLIHFATGEQDVRRFGSLGKRLSLVSASLLVASGALACSAPALAISSSKHQVSA